VLQIPSSALLMNLIQVNYLTWKQLSDAFNGVLT
jgi:hypothetical protein